MKPAFPVLVLSAQCLVVVAGVVAFAWRAPDRGAMLLLPLSAGGDGAAATLALSHGASILDRGPLAGSLVIYGTRAALDGPAHDAGMILLAAPGAGCSAAAELKAI